MVAFIDAHREAYGVEPICVVLPIAPSTYYEAKVRQADPRRMSTRAQRDGHLRDAITHTIATLPAQLRRSLTWDQGREMSQHVRLRIDTGLQIYFCDPHSPWQRGTNANTNGLLRQYFPKGTDLSAVRREDLTAVAFTLNRRPRKTLAWRTPAEALEELLQAHSTASVATTS